MTSRRLQTIRKFRKNTKTNHNKVMRNGLPTSSMFLGSAKAKSTWAAMFNQVSEERKRKAKNKRRKDLGCRGEARWGYKV